MAGKKPGNHSLLTPELQAQFVKYAEAGATIKDTCAMVGIAVPTYYDWMSIAEKWQAGEYHRLMPRKVADREAWCKPYSEFSEAVKSARARARIASVARIRKDDSWQANAWFLERSDPENWGRHTYAHIEGLDNLLKVAKEKGIPASDLFNAMIAELMSVNEDEQSGG